jgi:hypothetical protein
MRKKIFRQLAAVTIGCILAAGSISAQESAGLPFVRIDRDPVSAGMGFAGVASPASTAYAAFRNSSLIPFTGSRISSGFNVQSWAPKGAKSTNFNFGTSLKLTKGLGISLGVASQAGEKYSVMSSTGEPKGTFKPSDFIIGGGAGLRILKRLSLGADFRYASQKLSSDYSTSALCADVFLTYRTPWHLTATVGRSSFGSDVKSDSGESFSLPSSTTLGFYMPLNTALARLRFALDFDYYDSGEKTVASGMEVNLLNLLSLRGGYHYGSEGAVLPSFWTLGLGVGYRGIKLDFAYLMANEDIGDSLTFGLAVSF